MKKGTMKSVLKLTVVTSAALLALSARAQLLDKNNHDAGNHDDDRGDRNEQASDYEAKHVVSSHGKRIRNNRR